MGAAAHLLPADRNGDWIEELERILIRFDELSESAKDAIGSVVRSILRESDATDADVDHVDALLARHSASQPPL
jgi:hypothetical protein